MKPRHDQILGEVVRAYLETGAPIGSRCLSSTIGISPATIRNAMAELEGMGLLCSPHTSAGRQPTDLGLRYFVDGITTVAQDVRERMETAIASHLPKPMNDREVLKQASEELASLTRFAGLVAVREREFDRIARVELVPISSEQILIVLVSAKDEVQNHLVRRPVGLTDSKLHRTAQQISEMLNNRSLTQAQLQLRQQMFQDRQQISQLLEDLKQQIQNPNKGETELVVSGQSHLFECPEFTVIDTVRSLFSAFEEKEDLLSLLDQVERAESGVKIFIGSEHALVHMEEVSMVLSRYEGANQTIGTLGVIGPRCMNYQQVLLSVDCTARWVSKMLGGTGERSTAA